MEERSDDTFFVMPAGRQFVVLEGMEKCCSVPDGSQRVWYQRTATGSGTIYLFANKPKQRVTSWYAEQAFGWIAEWASTNIWLPSEEGWCNFWNRNSSAARIIEGLDPNKNSIFAEHYYIEFTDDIKYRLRDNTIMTSLGQVTNHRRQNQHWRTRAVVASAVLAAPYGAVDGDVTDTKPKSKPLHEGEPMGFDPQSVLADQQRRLSAQQGTSKVNNLKQACSSALSNVVDNNKAAAVDAGFLTAGTIANNQFSKVASKHLPMLVRGYADTPFGKLVLANAAQMLVQHFKPNHKTAARLTEAMMTSAMAEVIGSTGIEDLIDGFLSDPKIAKALSTVDSAAGTD